MCYIERAQLGINSTGNNIFLFFNLDKVAKKKCVSKSCFCSQGTEARRGATAGSWWLSGDLQQERVQEGSVQWSAVQGRFPGVKGQQLIQEDKKSNLDVGVLRKSSKEQPDSLGLETEG